MLNARVRKTSLQEMRQTEFDLVIVGGGITGAGVARDAASRGMSVALIEAQDYAAGTSSRSSKLIHGGIRYLENLEFHLVFEALRERRLLFEIAPHLVHPLRFVLPLYKSGRVGMAKMSLGMWLYDALALFETPEIHARLSVQQTMATLPWLREEELLGAFAYSDAYMDDDRLVLETLRSASKMGAKCVNYAKVLNSNIRQGKITSLNVQDLLSGERFEIRGKHFVCTAGPWTDLVGQNLLPEWDKRMRPTKGIHLTFLKQRFPLEQAVVMALEQEDRIVFGIPRHEMVIVGTTDTDYKGDPGDVATHEADVRYLLKVVNDYFPGAKLTEEDIVASYSGVRPLVADGASSESKTSREHVIFSDPHGLTVVTGGKYTTYRNMAEQTVRECLRAFPIEKRIQFGRSQTQVPLNELASPEYMERARALIETWSGEMHLPPSLVGRAVERHGFEAVEILNRLTRWKASVEDLEIAYWMAEADFAIDETQCLTLQDFYLRRSPLFLARPDHGFLMFDSLSRVFVEKLQQTDEDLKLAKAALRKHVEKEMGWR